MATVSGALSRQVRGVFLAPYPDGDAYGFHLVSGATTGLASSAPIVSFRGSATRTCLLYVARLLAFQPTGFANSAYVGTELVIARAFTASDSGGVAATLTGNSGKFRTADRSTTIQDLRIADTSALTAGTRTLDPHPVGAQLIVVTTSANANLSAGVNLVSVAAPDHPYPQPVVLAPNEGAILRVASAYPATGTIVWRATIGYVEVDSW